MNDPGPYAAEFLRRVRAWPVSSWRHARREPVARTLLDTLAESASRADGRPRPTVPDAGPHALADQLQVLVCDALDAGVDAAEVDTLLQAAATDLGLRVR